MDYPRIVSEFIELVRINSESKNERVMANTLKNKLSDLGCDVLEDESNLQTGGTTGNIIARLPGDMNKPTILLSAHMDRVMSGCNISPIIENEIIKTDGNTILAADDISGIAAILDGIRRIKEENFSHGNLEIIFSACEEVGVLGTKYIDYSKIKSKLGFVFDSSGDIGRIINEAPSKYKIIINVYGKASHAGNEPEKGINALKIASIALSQIKEGRINSCTTSNFGVIRGGTSTNVVCDYVEIQGEIRSTSYADVEKYLVYLKAVLDEISDSYNSKIEIEVEEMYKSFYVTEDDSVINILRNAMNKLGIDHYLSSGGGGMDANRFNDVGIISVGIATGYHNNHTKNEYIKISDLIKSGELVKEVVIQASLVK